MPNSPVFEWYSYPDPHVGDNSVEESFRRFEGRFTYDRLLRLIGDIDKVVVEKPSQRKKSGFAKFVTRIEGK